MTPAELVDCLERGVGQRYRLVRELGHGGMSIVFLASDIRHGRQVALKVLRPEIAAALGGDRFVREIRIAARLQHQHILGLYDSGDVEGILYYTMPFVEGSSLRERLAHEGQLALADAIGITRQVAGALGYAHRQGVVHRDIKPGNILLVGPDAFVADFGVARAVAEAGTAELTKSGLAVGTPAYMSPEQASGDSHVNGRADIYALGCVLYEMLAGEPPFSGRTPQAVLARHLHDPPPSLRVVRPLTPVAVQEVLEQAMAKVPADRFPSAEEFSTALEKATQGGVVSTARPRRSWRRVAIASIVFAAAGIGLGIWNWVGRHNALLDPNRVVVFPLRDRANTGDGEGVATYVGYALEGAAPVRWLEGWDWVGGGSAGAGALTQDVAVTVSRRQRARYYIDGAIIRGPDSTTVVLRLHDVLGDTLVKTVGASSPASVSDIPQLGLRAVGELLPALLEPGRRIDLSALAQRRPTAIAAFLQGEREYRRMRFGSALAHYQRAVREDSVFALAALRGAQSANWREMNEEADRLVGLAIASERGLPPRYADYARGLKDYLRGDADSAAADFRRALAIDPSWSDGWMALGETYYHLLPGVVSPDSLAEAAFLASQRSDTAFTPPLFHLAEIALRKGDVKGAARLIQSLKRAELDSALGVRLAFMLGCVRDGSASVDWRRASARSPAMVLSASKLLSVGAAQTACAGAGFRAVLESDSATTQQRWGALLGLQGILTAGGKLDSVEVLLDSKVSVPLWGKVMYLVVAGAGAGLDRRADEVAKELGVDYGAMGGPTLWALGTRAARRGAAEDLQSIAAALQAKADSSRGRLDVLLAQAMRSRALVASGDTAAGVIGLAALRPNASIPDLEWQPWESLPGERLELAELLMSRREYARADTVAAELQAPQPVVYLTYLPAALVIRIRAALAMGQTGNAERLRARLSAIQHGSSGPS